MPSNHLILCHPLLLLPSIFPSIRVFSNESALCIRRPKYWSFSFTISPSNEHSGLISFRTDWLDLLAVQGTLKSSPRPQFKAGLGDCNYGFSRIRPQPCGERPQVLKLIKSSKGCHKEVSAGQRGDGEGWWQGGLSSKGWSSPLTPEGG